MSNSPFDNKESEVRKDKFLKAYAEICKRYDYELMAYPQYIPSGATGFNTAAILTTIDKKEVGIKSPLQEKDIIK